jgi:hypothetical protein
MMAMVPAPAGMPPIPVMMAPTPSPAMMAPPVTMMVVNSRTATNFEAIHAVTRMRVGRPSHDAAQHCSGRDDRKRNFERFHWYFRRLAIALTIADEITRPVIDRELAVALIRGCNRTDDRCARQSPAPNPMAVMPMPAAATKPANRAVGSRAEIRTVTGP